MGSIQINSNQLNSYATGRSIYLTKNKHSPQAGRQIEGLHQNTVQTSFKSKLKFSIRSKSLAKARLWRPFGSAAVRTERARFWILQHKSNA